MAEGSFAESSIKEPLVDTLRRERRYMGRGSRKSLALIRNYRPNK